MKRALHNSDFSPDHPSMTSLGTSLSWKPRRFSQVGNPVKIA
jgi:hypothetical protein